MLSSQIADIGRILGMDSVVRFRERLECAYVADRDVLKLYHPRSARRLGGQPEDRILTGSIGLVLRSEFSSEGSRAWLARPASLSMCDLMNFPTIVACSALPESGDIGPAFVSALRKLLSALPNTVADMKRSFGDDFLERPPLDRIPAMTQFLRAQA